MQYTNRPDFVEQDVTTPNLFTWDGNGPDQNSYNLECNMSRDRNFSRKMEPDQIYVRKMLMDRIRICRISRARWNQTRSMCVRCWRTGLEFVGSLAQDGTRPDLLRDMLTDRIGIFHCLECNISTDQNFLREMEPDRIYVRKMLMDR